MKNILRQASYFFGGMGAICILVPFIPSATSKMMAAIEQQNADTLASIEIKQVKRDEQFKRSKNNERFKTLQNEGKLGEHIKYSSRTVENYTDDINNRPRIDASAFEPNEQVQIYDRNGICIGRVRNQRFEWKKDYLNTCLSPKENN